MDIVDIMMDMETNTRVSILTHFYKGIHTKEIDFDKYSQKVELEFSDEKAEVEPKDDNIFGALVGDIFKIHKSQNDF